jgi:hypothetical protein
MEPFKPIPPEEDLNGMIERVYETRLDVERGWGYGQERFDISDYFARRKAATLS